MRNKLNKRNLSYNLQKHFKLNVFFILCLLFIHIDFLTLQRDILLQLLFSHRWSPIISPIDAAVRQQILLGCGQSGHRLLGGKTFQRYQRWTPGVQVIWRFWLQKVESGSQSGHLRLFTHIHQFRGTKCI